MGRYRVEIQRRDWPLDRRRVRARDAQVALQSARSGLVETGIDPEECLLTVVRRRRLRPLLVGAVGSRFGEGRGDGGEGGRWLSELRPPWAPSRSPSR